MYKVGDKLICIQSTDYNVYSHINVGDIRTISEIILDIDGIFYRIDDNSYIFSSDSAFIKHFISLKELKKQKIKKINISCIKI